MKKLPAYFFIKSRSKLKELLLPSSVAIISSNRLMPRNGDQHFPFRQSSDLYYLCGIMQEQCTLVIYPDQKPDLYNEILYIPEGDEKGAKWDGDKLSTSDVTTISGITDVRYIKDLKNDILGFLSDSSNVYFSDTNRMNNSPFPSNEMEIRRELSLALKYQEEHELAPLMTRIRMFKEPEEIMMMKHAISVTNIAFLHVLRELRPGMSEYEIAAILSYEFQVHGVKEHAFDPIIASGKNGLVLHYISNRDVCNAGELLLMDFGADWEYYAADISRTIPVSGRYSKRQRALYNANLKVMQKAIQLMKPGILLRDFNSAVCDFWEKEHVDLGLYTMSDIKKQSEQSPLWQKYYWHNTSHSIGIDVHDRFEQTALLKPGMVLSCEPGIYIPEEETGIRLENDILITEDAAVNLSEDIPIEPDVIEELMNRG